MKHRIVDALTIAACYVAVVGALLVVALMGYASVLADAEGSVDVGTVNEALQQWELIVAFVQPLVIAFFISPDFSQKVQTLIMVAVSAVVTVVTMYLNGTLDNGTDYVTSLLKVIALTIAYYKGIWKPAGTAPTIETRIGLK